MINLLPPQYAMRIKFGRSNTVLRRWIIGTVLAMAGLLVIIASGWLYLNQQAADLQSSLDATNAQLQAQNLVEVQKDSAEITGDIKAITKVLSSEIRFSDLTQDIGRIMPPNTVLSQLSLSHINGSIDLMANSVTSSDAAQIAANLNDPANGIFSKVDIVNITCDESSKSLYKCTDTYRALFSAAAQKKYINVPQVGK